MNKVENGYSSKRFDSMEYNLDPIFEYGMNEDETTAYKIGLLWITLSKHFFPNCKRMGNYPKKGDPRKSSLFRYAHTFMKKSRGVIEPKDYKLFIVAQLQMLKSITIGDLHPNIGPWCLIGDKAWTRWKIWKKKFDASQSSKSVKEAGLDKVSLEDVKKELVKSKNAVKNKIVEYKEENFKIKSKEIERLLSLGIISGFYAVLSPWFKKHCNPGDIDLTYFKNNISEEAISYFEENFKEEL